MTTSHPSHDGGLGRPTSCALGPALIWLDTRKPLLSEAAFYALAKAGTRRVSRKLREALITALVDGHVRHSGTLVVMDYDYAVEEKGKPTRDEVELGILQETYVAAGHLWHIDRVDFYLSSLDLTGRPKDLDIPEKMHGIDHPWLRLRDIKVNVEDLSKVDTTALPRRDLGGAPPKIDWDEFWCELICHLYEDGTPHDTAHWQQLNTDLRRTFVGKIDESYIRRKTRALRALLQKRGHIKPPPAG